MHLFDFHMLFTLPHFRPDLQIPPPPLTSSRLAGITNKFQNKKGEDLFGEAYNYLFCIHRRVTLPILTRPVGLSVFDFHIPQNIKVLVATLNTIVANASCVLLVPNPTVSENLLNVKAKVCQSFQLVIIICDMINTQLSKKGNRTSE